MPMLKCTKENKNRSEKFFEFLSDRKNKSNIIVEKRGKESRFQLTILSQLTHYPF